MKIKKFIYAIGLAISLVGLSKGSYNYVYLPSKSQKGATCGYYALANAHAVQQLFNENKTINAENIALLTEQTLINYFAPFFEEEFNQLSNEIKQQHKTMLAYAESQTDLLDFDKTVSRAPFDCHFFTMLANSKNKLDDAYAIQYVSKDRAQEPVFIVGSNNADVYGTALQNIKEVNKKIVHFLYNLGSDKSGHWVYIGIVKQPNQRPYILHLNSTNNNSNETSQEFRSIVQHIVNCIEHGQCLMNDTQTSNTVPRTQVETEEDAQLAQAIQVSLQDEQLAEQRRASMQKENDHAYAKKLQEEDDCIFAQKIQAQENKAQENKDFAYARQLQEQDDRDYAFALSLSEE